MAQEITPQRATAASGKGQRQGHSGGHNRAKQIHKRLHRRLLVLGVAVALVVAALMVGAAYFSTASDSNRDGVLAVLRTPDYHAFAFSPQDRKVVFFGYHNGILRSADGGRTWRPLAEKRDFDAMSLAVDRANPQHIYIAGHDVLQKSSDAGVSWQTVASNLPGTDHLTTGLSQELFFRKGHALQLRFLVERRAREQPSFIGVDYDHHYRTDICCRAAVAWPLLP